MEATFQSYLTEAVYAMEREKRRSQRLQAQPQDLQEEGSKPNQPQNKSTSNLHHGFISYIDADSEGEADESKHNEEHTSEAESSSSAAVTPVVKMREGGGRKRGPRPSGLNMNDPSPSPVAFKRNMKFFMSVNKKRRSPPVFYLQRSQSTKEMGAKMSNHRAEPTAESAAHQKSIFRTFALKRTRTWGSLVAHLNRSFRGASPSKQAFSNAWRRSQSCRNIERLFNSRR